MRHCYTEQTFQLDRLKQSKQAVEEEKALVEASCKHLEEELQAATRQARDKDEALTTSLTNIQAAKRDFQIALDGKLCLCILSACATVVLLVLLLNPFPVYKGS